MDFTVDKRLLRHIHANLEGFARQSRPRKGLQEAAVALAIVDIQESPDRDDMPFQESRTGHAAIILTRRAAGLQHHAGQWALPGGRIDAGESPEDTVLRELHEEVGLHLDASQVIGCLDEYCTRSGFIITPIVVWGGRDVSLTANPEEVASIHRIPLAELMRDDAPVLQKIPESENPVLFMPIGDTCVAAPTAAMMYQFREVALSGNEVRVAHYEQPRFAWQ